MHAEKASPLLPMVAMAACRSQSTTSLSKLPRVRLSLLDAPPGIGAGREGAVPAQPNKNNITARSARFIDLPFAASINPATLVLTF
jgi:hypothetical protein